MDEKEIVRQIVESTALEAYKDSAKPALQVMGKSLAQCISLFASPIGRTAQILENNINKVLDKLEGVKKEDLVSPDTRILVPVLEKMRYTEDEEVANYYAEILAAASKKETKGKVILSFIEILNRVTADEIKILEFINSVKNTTFVEASTIMTEEVKLLNPLLNPETLVPIPLGKAIPMIDVHVETEGTPGYQILLNNFNNLPDSISLEFPENIDSYLDNLISLGLLHIPHGKGFANESIYKSLKEHQKVKGLEKNLQIKQKINFENSRIDLTNLSLKLLSLCSK
jgi:hypothetical protein